MRKFLRSLTIVPFIIISLCSLAQEKTISGTVISGEDNKTPLNGVTIKVKGTQRSVLTDAKGFFSIKVNSGETLQLTYVGFQPMEIKPGANNTLNITLKPADNTLGEVVVTAMDIKRNPRELGYSVQTVKGSDLQQTQRENFLNGLQGRVAGLTVTPTSGAAGASTGIVLRGYNTLSGNNQPLFIVDGIIIDNQTLNSNSQSGSGIGLAS
ncbi:MAG TPA: carboxypeptidase-like regulatory domain-containing protein, partial [Chitinophagaceae bacterium]|nr:carboxypeptidase-like regulatory domain-containing protein [Chitinophagaceae bacterium]